MFDVTMGRFLGAETCELVGLYILDKLAGLLRKQNVGLYQGDGLAVAKNANGPTLDKSWKAIIAICKAENLSITTNLIETDS